MPDKKQNLLDHMNRISLGIYNREISPREASEYICLWSEQIEEYFVEG
jgi:hypothetical protein